ncbi:MAG: T9SS type A sorting domain-containing protein [Bacteroidota bacterium]
MKYSILISLSLFLTSNIYSQSYRPILSEKNEWSVNTFGPGISIDELFFTGPDTLIDSIQYWPLIQRNNNAVPNPFYLMGYLKEDTSQQSLSYFEADSEGNFDLTQEKFLYRFDLQVGDTIIVQSQDTYPGGGFFQDTLEVEAIEYQTSSTNCTQNSWFRDSVKLIVLNSIRTNAWLENSEITWIEGTGAASFILMPAFNACGVTTVNCHHKDDLLVYQSLRAQQLDTCLLNTSLEVPKQKLTLSVSPNPSLASATISYANPNAEERQIILRNLQGQSLWTERSRAENIEIKRKNWAAGIYFIEVLVDGRRLGQSKIVFQ